jgi:hypothetical protein
VIFEIRVPATDLHVPVGLRDGPLQLLSSSGATASDVARVVGYGSLDAMGRVFRNARFPAPSVVLDGVRYPLT